ncbi:MAG: DUF559 domain-containing protein [Actinomycetota bacterium]|nr:DUF559 domain-containing protein [Actinomycetota bacterium]
MTRGQLIAAGITKSMLQGRVRSGRLLRVHPGVYRVAGAPQTFEQRCFAAAAWGADGAVVSHATAARLWHMIDASPPVSDICCPRKRTRPPGTICVHFAPDLHRRDHGKLRNIPVTSPSRTLIDLARVWPEAQVEHALQRAVIGGCVSGRVLRERVAAMPPQGNRGRAVLRRLLRDPARSGVQSPLERAVARSLSRCDLPPFSREHPVYIDGRVLYVDFAWPHFRVGVEADGRRWHSDERAFETDRERQNLLTAAGWRLLRVTSDHVRSNFGQVCAQVRELLTRG